jgi:hypothetical protein
VADGNLLVGADVMASEVLHGAGGSPAVAECRRSRGLRPWKRSIIGLAAYRQDASPQFHMPWRPDGCRPPPQFSFDVSGGLPYASKEAATGMPSTVFRGMLRVIEGKRPDE